MFLSSSLLISTLLLSSVLLLCVLLCFCCVCVCWLVGVVVRLVVCRCGCVVVDVVYGVACVAWHADQTTHIHIYKNMYMYKHKP